MQFQQRPEEGYHGTEIPRLPDVRAALVQILNSGFEFMAIILP